MKAILIFAGLSSRFWPLTEKCLWPIAGKTILEHQVDRLQAGGIEEIILVGSNDNLKHVRSLKLKNVTLVTQTADRLGMREGFLAGLRKLKKDEPVLLVNSNDIIEPAAYAQLIEKMKKLNLDGILLAKKVTTYFPGGYLTVKGKRITGIVEKPGAGKEPSNLVNIVAHAHCSAGALRDELVKTKTTKEDGYEQTLDRLFKTGRYEALPYKGIWQAIKYPWHLLPALELFLADIPKQMISLSANIHPSAVIMGSVIIDDGVRVLPHATIVGPCYIGKNTIVANNALVRASSVGDNCVVGYSTEVVRSILRKDVWTHMTYIGDSIVDENVSFGGGTSTGNLRLDEQEISSVVKGETVPTGLTKFGAIIGAGCRTGIHCSLSPGVKIGAGSFISSAVLINQDIPDGSFVKWKHAELDIRKNKAQSGNPKDREKFRKKV